MIRNLLIPDYRLHNILAIIGTLSFTLLILHLLLEEAQYTPAIVIATGVWGIFTVWEQITVHDGWKVINDEQAITQRLLLRNGTHLSMLGDPPFARGPLVDVIGLDGERAGVEDMLQGTFDTDNEDMDSITASSEMTSFLKALKIPISATTGSPVPPMVTDMTMEESRNIFGKTKESTASSPSGIHYGHYIAACESDALSVVNRVFMVTPFKASRPLSRWINMIHYMIQKLKVPYVTKLRIIKIHEADFNTMLKFVLCY